MAADDAAQWPHDRPGAEGTECQESTDQRIEAREEDRIEYERRRRAVDIKIVPFDAASQQTREGRCHRCALRLDRNHPVHSPFSILLADFSRSAFAALSMALTMLSYPVQRQRLPLMARRMSASVGSGFPRSRLIATMIIPDVQKPHWNAPHVLKASCLSLESASRLP